MAWEDRYKYLGMKRGADHSTDLNKVDSENIGDVEVTASSELTDWQKLDGCNACLCQTTVLATKPTAIKWMGQDLVKANMKLPRRTNNAFLFSPPCAVGLG